MLGRLAPVNRRAQSLRGRSLRQALMSPIHLDCDTQMRDSPSTDDSCAAHTVGFDLFLFNIFTSLDLVLVYHYITVVGQLMATQKPGLGNFTAKTLQK